MNASPSSPSSQVCIDVYYGFADQAYERAFAGHGFESRDFKELQAAQTAALIRASAICKELLAALDDWADIQDTLPPHNGEKLRALARLVDDDAWSKELREAHISKDRPVLQRLADDKAILVRVPADLERLSDALARVGDLSTSVQLLRRAQNQYPADFWINFTLAQRLEHNAATYAEAAGFYRAALAARPNTPAAYSNTKNKPLTMILTAPDGTKVTLLSGSVVNGTLTFRTAAFDFKSLNGTWKLEVNGLAGGTLKSWSLAVLAPATS